LAARPGGGQVGERAFSLWTGAVGIRTVLSPARIPWVMDIADGGGHPRISTWWHKLFGPHTASAAERSQIGYAILLHPICERGYEIRRNSGGIARHRPSVAAGDARLPQHCRGTLPRVGMFEAGSRCLGPVPRLGGAVPGVASGAVGVAEGLSEYIRASL